MRGAGSGQNPPGPAPYIKGLNPDSLHFLSSTLSLPLFFSVSLFVLLWNPNPNFVHTAQKLKKHGSIASLGCSKHESTVGNYMHSLNQRRSWIFFSDSKRFWLDFLWFKSFSDEILMDSYGLQLFLHIVIHIILSRFFWKILGFHVFEPNSFGSLRIYVDSGSLMFLSMKR